MSDNNAGDSIKQAGQKAAEAIEGTSGDHSVFDAKGSIGKQFQPDGAVGSVGESIGGPLSSDGAIGKQFTTKGSIGGAVQNQLGDQK